MPAHSINPRGVVAYIGTRAFLAGLLAWGVAQPAWATLRDIEGQPVPARPYRRIVSLAPANTELLYAIGWGDRVVGVSSFCDFPKEARLKPKVGGPETINVEQVLALAPDLILASPLKSPEVSTLARLSSVPVVILQQESLDGIAENAENLGAILGPEGAAFATRFRRELASIKPSRRHPRVFYMVWDSPLMTAGPGTYHDDLIRKAGGRNIARAEGYTAYSEETLLANRPDVLIYSENLKTAAETQRKRLRVPGVPLPANAVSRPAPRILQVLRDLVRELDRN